MIFTQYYVYSVFNHLNLLACIKGIYSKRIKKGNCISKNFVGFKVFTYREGSFYWSVPSPLSCCLQNNVRNQVPTSQLDQLQEINCVIRGSNRRVCLSSDSDAVALTTSYLLSSGYPPCYSYCGCLSF